jgi:hypothetical protein
MTGYREQPIAAVSVPTDPIRCPRCKGQTLVLKGNVTRGFEERLEDGLVVEQQFVDFLERETSVIDCIHCKISWQVMTEAEVELMLKNEELETTIITSALQLDMAGKIVH